MPAVQEFQRFIDQPTRSPSGSLAEFYAKEGYAVIPNALSSELAELRAETLAICAGERGDEHPASEHGAIVRADPTVAGWRCRGAPCGRPTRSEPE